MTTTSQSQRCSRRRRFGRRAGEASECVAYVPNLCKRQLAIVTYPNII